MKPTKEQQIEWQADLENKTVEELKYVFDTEYLHHWKRRSAKEELERRYRQAMAGAADEDFDVSEIRDIIDDPAAGPDGPSADPGSVSVPGAAAEVEAERHAQRLKWSTVAGLTVVLLAALDFLVALSFKGYDSILMGAIDGILKGFGR